MTSSLMSQYSFNKTLPTSSCSPLGQNYLCCNTNKAQSTQAPPVSIWGHASLLSQTENSSWSKIDGGGWLHPPAASREKQSSSKWENTYLNILLLRWSGLEDQQSFSKVPFKSVIRANPVLFLAPHLLVQRRVSPQIFELESMKSESALKEWEILH